MRGEGCYVWDHARQALARRALGPVHRAGRPRPPASSPTRPRSRPRRSSTSRSGRYAHPPAIELATTLAELAPGDLNRVFFTTGGSEAVESAWKLARQYFRAIGQPQRYKVIARRTAYHGTTMGALAITGRPELPRAVRAAHARRRARRRTPTAYRHPLAKDEHAFMTLTDRRDRGGDPLRRTRDGRGRVSSSRCRTRAAASRRRRATSSASARSATATACCSSPTRSSARSAGSARCSAASATTTCPT